MFTELAAINFIFAQLDKFTSVKLPFCSIGFIKAIVVLIDNITTSIIAKEPNINNLYFLFINTNHPNHYYTTSDSMYQYNFKLYSKIYFRGELMNISRLKEIRENHDLYQKDIANLLGITQQQYSKYDLGINAISLEKINILADYYETSIDYLTCRTDERKPYNKSILK